MLQMYDIFYYFLPGPLNICNKITPRRRTSFSLRFSGILAILIFTPLNRIPTSLFAPIIGVKRVDLLSKKVVFILNKNGLKRWAVRIGLLRLKRERARLGRFTCTKPSLLFRVVNWEPR